MLVEHPSTPGRPPRVARLQREDARREIKQKVKEPGSRVANSPCAMVLHGWLTCDWGICRIEDTKQGITKRRLTKLMLEAANTIHAGFPKTKQTTDGLSAGRKKLKPARSKPRMHGQGKRNEQLVPKAVRICKHKRRFGLICSPPPAHGR